MDCFTRAGCARGNGHARIGGRRPTAINGTTVTVQVTGGNPIVREYVGQMLTLRTTSSTRYLLKTNAGTVPITFADLAVGQKVSASGKVANNMWTATRITVGAALVHLP
jgi:hypothetical protein